MKWPIGLTWCRWFVWHNTRRLRAYSGKWSARRRAFKLMYAVMFADCEEFEVERCAAKGVEMQCCDLIPAVVEVLCIGFA